MADRQSQFENWLMIQCDESEISLQALAKDASFRRYFCLAHDPQWLAVDAPPEHEKNHEFVAVAEAFSKIGIRVPAIKAYDLEQGFLLVENLGPDSYLKVLQAHPHRADILYKQAIDKLVDLASTPAPVLDHFNQTFLQTELDNFTAWFLEQYLGCNINGSEKRLLQKAYDYLIISACAQTQVCIHRDYHSRNLIVREQENPGVIDFQDAMLGPLTYDLVSLLRDAYIAWPREQVEVWARYFYDAYSGRHQEFKRTWPEFLDDFNLMGVQRNLKAIFIFVRKWLRDKDAGYLNDIPRTLNYILSVSQHYPQLKVFHDFLSEHIQPTLEKLA